MKVTVAICTWNRARVLAQTLEGLTAIRQPSGFDWELVVVNNNSTDNTEDILEDYTSRLPLKRVFEARQGHSQARNAAVGNALGEYTVWTDDDVVVEPDWLDAYVRAFDRHPRATLFGGPVRARFEGGAPKWLASALHEEAVSVALALRDFGDQEQALSLQRLPFGANMAFRTDRLRANRFDPNLGRKGSGLLGADEVTVMASMLEDGDTGWWVPDARVLHLIPPERQSVAYLRRYWLSSGQTDAMLYPTGGKISVLGIPAWLWKEAVVSEVRYRVGRLLRPPERWVVDLRSAASAWGRLRGIHKANRSS